MDNAPARLTGTVSAAAAFTVIPILRTLVAFGLIVSSGPGVTAPPRVPAGQWAIEYQDETCTLSRDGLEGELGIAIRTGPLDERHELMLYGPFKGEKGRHFQGRLSIEPDGVAADRPFVLARRPGRKPTTLQTDSRLRSLLAWIVPNSSASPGPVGSKRAALYHRWAGRLPRCASARSIWPADGGSREARWRGGSVQPAPSSTCAACSGARARQITECSGRVSCAACSISLPMAEWSAAGSFIRAKSPGSMRNCAARCVRRRASNRHGTPPAKRFPARS